MKADRTDSVQDDSGFLKLIGDRLIVAANAAFGKMFTKEIILEAVEDQDERKEILALLLSKTDAKKFLKASNEDELSQLGSSDENSSNSDLDATDLIDTEERGLVNCDLPNRPVSKSMMSNRGIVKYRHKRERNPRIHLKHKYKKATIRYRSRIAPVLNQNKPYAGETKGIRAHQKSKSFKFAK
ncbi:Something about silencing protein 10 [Cichlidogyrus casuarinus]|uniref:Something about silencing protein 10 n=1 Tax=Cichlidogyrus casuarinus TaxID=1844966 RepID=A0ABD2QA21_9PLAT